MWHQLLLCCCCLQLKIYLNFALSVESNVSKSLQNEFEAHFKIKFNLLTPLRIPKTPWIQILVICCLGIVGSKISFHLQNSSIIFELHNSWAFWQHPSMCNYKFVWVKNNSMVKMGCKLNFLVFFWGASRGNHVANITQGLQDRVPKNKFVWIIRSLISTFFRIFLYKWFCMLSSSMWMLRYGINCLSFSKKISKFHSVGGLVKYLH